MADNIKTTDRDTANLDIAAKDILGVKYPRNIIVTPAGADLSPLTDIELRASAVPVSGPLTDAELRAAAVPISAESLPLPAGAATQATLAAILSALGTPAQAGGVFGAAQFGPWTVTANAGTGTFAVSVASLPLPSGAATESTLAAQSAKLPAALGSTSDSGSLSVAQSTEGKVAIGATNETAPASDTASSGLNGRLQRIAQRITSLIALLPSSLGIKTASGSLSVAPASDGVFRVASPLTARSSSALTITLASLAHSGALTVGRCSSAYDNTTNVDEFLSLAAKITTGTSPTASKTIEVWVFAELADGVWPDLFSSAYSGADGGFTVRSREILFGGARLVGAINTGSSGNTSDVPYTFAATDIAALLGGVVRKFAVFVTQDTGVSLNATGGNHSVNVKPHYRA